MDCVISDILTIVANNSLADSPDPGLGIPETIVHVCVRPDSVDLVIDNGLFVGILPEHCLIDVVLLVSSSTTY